MLIYKMKYLLPIYLIGIYFSIDFDSSISGSGFDQKKKKKISFAEKKE